MTPIVQTVAQTAAPLAANRPASREPKAGPSKIGSILVARGKITQEDFKTIIAEQQATDMRFGEAAVSLGLVEAEDVKAVLAEQFDYASHPELTSSLDARLSAIFQPESQAAEALRSLRSELLLRHFNKGSHLSLALVGADDAEAIALTAANLAVSFAQLGVRTLLVDANLRNPQLGEMFGQRERSPGLSDLIAGRAVAEPLAVPALRSLWLLPAGTKAPNPQELLASQFYGENLSQLSQGFDITLISTTPLTEALDAQLVAARAGAALLVARENVSRMKDLEAICQRLRGLGVQLLGAALRQ